jgi:glycosyltransferase involved in cell wall biosynthesis
MADPLVSICIPVYNHQPYIKEAIRSALSQDYPNFEVVICDDNSTDGSWEYLKSLQDPRVRLFRNSINLGASANHNLSVGHARGEFIKFLPPDDELLPDSISSMAPWLKRFSSVVAIVGGCEYIDNRSLPIGESSIVDRTILVRGTEMIRQLFQKGNIIGNPGFPLFRKTEYERVNGMRENLLYTWDGDLWMRLCRSGDWIFLPKIVFRNRPENKCSISFQIKRSNKLLILFKEEFLIAEYESEKQGTWHFTKKEMRQWMARIGGRHLTAGLFRLVYEYDPSLLKGIILEHRLRGLLFGAIRSFLIDQLPHLVRNYIYRRTTGTPWVRQPGRRLDIEGSPLLPVDRV